MQHVQPISRTPLLRSGLRAESDPAYLSATLRELALRTYHAFQTKGDARSGNGPASAEVVFHSLSRHDWTDLHSQIVQLERTLDAQHLDLLASYVAALRQKVENCLV
jgi:hypothetical protein